MGPEAHLPTSFCQPGTAKVPPASGGVQVAEVGIPRLQTGWQDVYLGGKGEQDLNKHLEPQLLSQGRLEKV